MAEHASRRDPLRRLPMHLKQFRTAKPENLFNSASRFSLKLLSEIVVDTALVP
jgi:hypothetical protein